MKWNFVGLLLGMGWSSASAWACEGATGSSEMTLLLDQSPKLLRAGQFDALKQNFGAVSALVPCLDEVGSPAEFARLHRLLGFARYVDKDDATARLYFARAQALDPTLQLAPDLVPSGHPVVPVWQAAASVSVQTAPVKAPREGELLWDGVPANARPTNVPTVLQIVNDDHAVVSSALLQPSDPLPSYPTAWGGPHTRALVWAGAGALAAVSVGGLVGGVVTEARWEAHMGDTAPLDDPTWEQEFENLERWNHVFVGISVATGALALGAGTLAVAGPWAGR